MATWKAEEIWVEFQRPDGYRHVLRDLKGARNAYEDKWMSRYQTDEIERKCLAEFVPALADAVFVTVPHVDGKGIPVPDDAYGGILEIASGDGRLIATMSGEGDGNYVRISEEAWLEIAAPFGDADGAKAVQAASLLFSSCTSAEKRVVIRVIRKDSPLDDGRDGNGLCGEDFAVAGVQTRFGQEVEPWVINPSCTGKGTFIPVPEDPGMGLVFKTDDGRDIVWVGEDQLKGAWPKDRDEFDGIVLLNEAVASERIVRDRETLELIGCFEQWTWLSSEVTVLFRDTKGIRRECAIRVREEIWQIISLLQEEHRIELLERLGVLKRGKMRPPKSAAEDLLLTPLPFCKEVEELIGRFMVPEIVQITLGAGIRVQSTIAVISALYGEAPITYEQAMHRKACGDKIWIVYRVPVNGAVSILYFARNPYKKGMGCVVTPEAMKIADGDADGDRVFIIGPKESARIIGWIDQRIAGGHKPTPEPKKGFNPRDAQALLDYWIDLLPTHSLVGRATLLGWRAIRDKRWEDASTALQAANAAPMLRKKNVRIDGKELISVINAMAEVEKLNSPLDDKGKPVVKPLLWRNFKAYCEGIVLVRDIAGWGHYRPESVLDCLANAAAEAVRKWAKENESYKMPLNRLAKLVRKNMQGEPHEAWAVWAAADIRDEWSDYWKAHRKEDGTLDDADHRGIFRTMREKFASADAKVLEAIMAKSTPEEFAFEERFTFRFFVFDVHRGTEILGYDPRVLAYFKAYEEYEKYEELIKVGLLRVELINEFIEKYGHE